MAKKPLDPEERTTVLPLEGLHCASCVARVEEALGRVPGVYGASVDLASRTATVAFGPALADLGSLRRAVERAGYKVLAEGVGRLEAEELGLQARRAEQAVLLRRWVGSSVLGAPLMAADWLGLSPYTCLVLALPIQLWAGWHFHEGLARSVRRRAADMDTLVSLGTWAAFFYSAAAVLAREWLGAAARQPQWDAVAGLVTFVTLGRWLESRTRGRANEAVGRMMRLSPKTVRRPGEDGDRLVPVGELRAGELFRVLPGDQVGLDGLVESGASTVDESLLTGESLPVEKTAGSQVWAGTMNKTGSLEVRVTRTAPESALARIVAAVRASQASKPLIQRQVDKVAAAFIPLVILAAASSGVLWALWGPEPRALNALTVFVSVLAVSCPCALGLATPLALIAGIGRAAERGIFIRNAEVLDAVGRLDVVLFDKTGTLTEGRPEVEDVILLRGSEDELWSLALASAERSEHPLAKALARRARGRKTTAAGVESFEAYPGRGTALVCAGAEVLVGSLSWLKDRGVAPPPERAAAFQRKTGSITGVAAGGRLLGAFVISDPLRPSARGAVSALKELGLEVMLVSGDRNAAAYDVAERAGIGTVFAEVLPQDKERTVARLKAEGKRVAMVGDGFNDAPALSQADVGISLASGTDVAVAASDLTLMNPDLTALAEAIRLSRRIRAVIRQNLFWAFLYNALLIPVAAGALHPFFGILLQPHYAGAAMALSSISVALNSLRLRRG